MDSYCKSSEPLVDNRHGCFLMQETNPAWVLQEKEKMENTFFLDGETRFMLKKLYTEVCN